MNYQLIAHRGYSAIAPENTLASFQASLDQPIWGVEFDVHLSADGVPVIIHDATLERTTNARGKVTETSIAQLQTLDAGSWFHPQFAEETIPTLEEVLKLFLPTPLRLYIEIKSHNNWSLSQIRNLLQLLKSWRDRCVLASFDHNLLHQIKAETADFTLGYALSSKTQYAQDYLETLDPKQEKILPHFSLVLEQPTVTKALLDQGWDIITWTVDDPKIAEQLGALNIVKIISNNLLQNLGA